MVLPLSIMMHCVLRIKISLQAPSTKFGSTNGIKRVTKGIQIKVSLKESDRR